MFHQEASVDIIKINYLCIYLNFLQLHCKRTLIYKIIIKWL